MARIHAGTLLAQHPGWISGQEMSRQMGVTRAAVWKELEALRQQGWPIEASPRAGYRLSAPPQEPDALWLNAKLPETSLFAGKVSVEPLVDSTNNRLKAAGASGAPAGTVLIALEQSGGRGTRGRSFASPRGEGLYLSVLLRPKASIEDILTLTGWAAAAVRDGIEKACGAPAQIKWLNDIWLNGRKLVGILTELTLLGESGEPDYVVLGMGVNLTQSQERFESLGLGDIAVSLQSAGWAVNPNTLALSLLTELTRLADEFPHNSQEWLQRYRQHCLTPGKRVSFEDGTGTRTGTALTIDNRFGLVVQPDNSPDARTISSGTVRILQPPV